jgi:hypothetical protein
MLSYTLPQTLMARLGLALGNRLAAPIALTICSVSSLLTPAAAQLGWQWVIACRLLNGLAAAGIISGLFKLLEDWMRYDELASGVTVTQLLIAASAAACPLFTGYLTARHWSLAFYVPSYATFAFCALWLVLVTDEPQQNWLISERELNHLGRDVGSRAKSGKQPPPSGAGAGRLAAADRADGPQHSVVGPLNDLYKPDSWTQIFKLPQLYAYMLIWSLYCSSYGGFFLVLPAYMRQFLKISVADNGLYCFVVHAGVLLGVSWPQQAIRVLAKWNLNITQARIVSQALCCLVMATTFICVGTFHQFQLPLLVLNRCFLGTEAIVTSAMMANFAKAGLSSLAFAIINTVGNFSTTATTALMGWLLDYTGSSRLGWQIIFCGLGAGQILLTVLFALFVDSEPIKFKNSNSNSDNDDEPKQASKPDDGHICPDMLPVGDQRQALSAGRRVLPEAAPPPKTDELDANEPSGRN